MKQIPLPITLEPHATFNSYYCADAYSASLIKHLENIHTQQPIILSGPSGVGKTHLLQAACQQQQQWLYLDATQRETAEPTLLENLDNQLVCIDNVDHLLRNNAWEKALFKLILNHQNRLLFSSSASLLNAKRADLSSRFQEMLTLKLPVLDEKEQCQALLHRAQTKGLKLNTTLIHWMQKNLERDNHFLFRLIEKLEKETLSIHKKPSLALIKSLAAKEK